MSQSNGPAPIEEQVHNLTSEPVSTARHNLNTEYKAIEERLAKLPLPIHGAIMQMLGAALTVRQEVMRNTIQDHAQRQQWEREQEEKRKAEALEKEQQAIAEANKPKLVTPGAPIQ